MAAVVGGPFLARRMPVADSPESECEIRPADNSVRAIPDLGADAPGEVFRPKKIGRRPAIFF
jgi:hypothetical protein